MKRAARHAAALLALALPLTALAQEALPEKLRDQLDAARAAAEAGDSAPALATIAALGSAKHPAPLRRRIAAELLEVGDELSLLKIHGAALDVFRGVARAFPDTPAAFSARYQAGESLTALGDRPGALRAFASLAGPAPPGAAPPLARAWERGRKEALSSCGKLLLQLKRPGDALQAFLDAELAGGLEGWRGPRLSALDLAEPLARLLRVDLSQELERACAAAMLLTAPRATQLQERWTLEVRAADLLQAVAVIVRQRDAALAKRAEQQATSLRLRRPYRLPSTSAEERTRLRLWRADLAAKRAALPALRRKAQAGDASARFRLGLALEAGRVIPADPARAQRLIAQAGASGHGPALTHLAWSSRDQGAQAHYAVQALAASERGVISRLGRPLRAELTAAARAVVRRRAEAGEPEALLLLADDAKAPRARHAWLLRAARTGEPHALLELTEAYTRGDGVAADPAAARFWRRCAVLLGQYRADLHWTAATQTKGIWRARLQAAGARYPAAAHELCWVALYAPSPRPAQALRAALVGLQTLTDDPLGLQSPARSPLWAVVRRHPAQAPLALKALRARKDAVALHVRAYARLRGKLGLERDHSRALALHRADTRARGAHECPTAFLTLRAFANGAPFGVSERSWARAAAKRDPWAEAWLGSLLEWGVGGPTDLDAARAHYARAAKRGSAAGLRLLAELETTLEDYAGAPRPRVNELLTQAGERGDALAWVHLARRLERAKQPKHAEQAWAKALAAKLPRALLRRADALLRGPKLTAAAAKQALPLLRSAAEAGSIDAYLRLRIVLRAHPTLRAEDDP